MEIYENKRILNIVLPVILSFLIEIYNILVENSNVVYDFSNIFSFFSFERFLILLIIFLIISHVLSNETWRYKIFRFIYVYRLPIAFLIIIFAVIFQMKNLSCMLMLLLRKEFFRMADCMFFLLQNQQRYCM